MPRPKGSKDIPKRKKAMILAQKNVGVCSNKKIAENFGVSESTVNQINSRTVDTATLLLSRKYQAELSARLDRINDKILDAIEKKVDEGGNKLTELSTAFGTLFDKQRLHQNQATEITQNYTESDLARELMRRLIEKRGWSKEKALAAAKQEFPEAELS